MKLLKVGENVSINLDSVVAVQWHKDDEGYVYEVYLYLPIQLNRDLETATGVVIWDNAMVEVTDEFPGYDRMIAYLTC